MEGVLFEIFYAVDCVIVDLDFNNQFSFRHVPIGWAMFLLRLTTGRPRMDTVPY